MAVVRMTTQAAISMPPSRHVKNLIKAGIAPNLCADAPGKYLRGIPDILKSNVKRREAKTHQVWRAEIADDTAFDHRLHDRITLVEGYSDLAAAQRWLAGCHDVKARQQRSHARHEKLRESETLLS